MHSYEETKVQFDRLLASIKGKHMSDLTAAVLMSTTEMDLMEHWVMTYPEVDGSGHFTGNVIRFGCGLPEGRDYSIVEWIDGGFHVIETGEENWQKLVKTQFTLPDGVDLDYVPVWVLACTHNKNLN